MFFRFSTKSGEGLVENDRFGVEHQQPAEFQQLLLAAGKRLGVFVAQVMQSQEFQHVKRLFFDLGAVA